MTPPTTRAFARRRRRAWRRHWPGLDFPPAPAPPAIGQTGRGGEIPTAAAFHMIGSYGQEDRQPLAFDQVHQCVELHPEFELFNWTLIAISHRDAMLTSFNPPRHWPFYARSREARRVRHDPKQAHGCPATPSFRVRLELLGCLLPALMETIFPFSQAAK